MVIKGMNRDVFAEVDTLLKDAFGSGAAGFEKRESFLNEIAPGEISPRRLMLLGGPLKVARLETEIKQVIRTQEGAPAPAA